LATGPVLPQGILLVGLKSKVPEGNPTTFPESVQWLKGKTIGVNSIGGSGDIYARQLMSDAGLEPGRDVDIIGVGTSSTSVPALKAGRVDAIAITWSTVAVAKEQGIETTVLVDPLAGNAPEALQHQSSIITITRSDVPDARFQRYCTAINKTLSWMKDPANADAGAEIVGELLHVSVANGKQVWQKEATAWQENISPELWAGDVKAQLDKPVTDLPYEKSVRQCS
jgi:ABC-type nitrate/sulfonate/bicarbonate transport system substrate-binding protein